MRFNDPAFLSWFVAVYAGFLLARHSLLATKTYLLAVSLAFYMGWGQGWVLLLVGSAAMDYAIGLALGPARAPWLRRSLLGVSLAGNLGVLGYFKYSRFLWDAIQGTPPPAGAWIPWSVLREGRLLIPLGLSFYTFQTLSYAIDRYRGRIPACRSFLDFLLYVSFFPQLVAGPILRAQDFLPQLDRAPRVRRRDVAHGAAWAILGLAKKMLLADFAAGYVDAAFAQPGRLGPGGAWLAMYAFAVQIYCDFSGYSDVARGLGRMMGYRIPRNFRRPYLATDPRSFWRRWHITLSEFLRDYLYIPLGGSRGGPARTTAALLATMLLGGLWHGPAWTFVAWGAFHGLLLVLHRAWRALTERGGAAPAWKSSLAWRGASILAMFHATCAGWVLFRAPTGESARAMLIALLPGRGTSGFAPGAAIAAGVVALFVLLHAGALDRVAHPRTLRRHPALAAAALGALAFLLSIPLAGGPSQDFIYFMF